MILYKTKDKPGRCSKCGRQLPIYPAKIAMGHGYFLFVDYECAAELLNQSNTWLKKRRDEIHNNHLSSKKRTRPQLPRVHTAGHYQYNPKCTTKHNSRMEQRKSRILWPGAGYIRQTNQKVRGKINRAGIIRAKHISSIENHRKVGKRSIHGRIREARTKCPPRYRANNTGIS